jgi:hypothetical protein
MVNVHGMARLGVLAVGLGIGAAVPRTSDRKAGFLAPRSC